MHKKSLRINSFFVAVSFLFASFSANAVIKLGIELNVKKQLSNQIEWVPKHFKNVRECLEDWHTNDSDGGILASSPNLTSAQCLTVTNSDRVSVSYNTTTGKICISTSDKLPGLENKFITCAPYIDGNGQASFLYCTCKHNIPYTSSGAQLTNGTVSLFLEEMGIMNCKYDSTITSCD